MYLDKGSLFLDKIKITFNGQPVPDEPFNYWDSADDEECYITIDSSIGFERLKGDVQFEFDTSELSEEAMRRLICKYG